MVDLAPRAGLSVVLGPMGFPLEALEEVECVFGVLLNPLGGNLCVGWFPEGPFREDPAWGVPILGVPALGVPALGVPGFEDPPFEDLGW